jgi:hypothetical protein
VKKCHALSSELQLGSRGGTLAMLSVEFWAGKHATSSVDFEREMANPSLCLSQLKILIPHLLWDKKWLMNMSLYGEKYSVQFLHTSHFLLGSTPQSSVDGKYFTFSCRFVREHQVPVQVSRIVHHPVFSTPYYK